MNKIHWNSQLYDTKHSFVSQYGESLLELLQAKEGERILDIGCGTGHLASKIQQTGATCLGFDASLEMIAKAKEQYPSIEFEVKDARNFSYPRPFDAIFSNATLHWIPEAEMVAHSIYRHLKEGGRFVAEFGGKNNIALMLAAMRKTMEMLGYTQNAAIDFWYFPSVGEYTSLLESAGFRVTYAAHYDRPTPLEGPEGVKNWFRMFGSYFFEGIPAAETEKILDLTQQSLTTTHLKEGNWYADYKRIRVVAVRE